MIAAQVINDSAHADKLSPVVCSVQNMQPATCVLLDCTLLGISGIFKSSLGLLAPRCKVKLLTLITDYTLAAKLKLPSMTPSRCETFLVCC